MEMIEDETAQVILIGGFLIAIGVVSAILMLNNISYSQTITSQNGDSGDFGPLEFADSTERAVSEAMTGNGSDPDGARDHFEAYIQSYSDRANEVVSEEGVSTGTDIPAPIPDLTEVWMAGQRSTGNFTNATGGDRWIMAEDISTNYKTEFELDVDEMNSTSGEFVMNATEDTDFDGLSNPLLSKDGWRLTMNITASNELILNMTDVDAASGLEFSTDSDEEPVSVSGNETVVVDVLNETVNGAGSAFPDGTSVTPRDAQGFIFDDASNGIGTYDFRFNESASFTDSNGPCNAGPPCRSADGTEKHIVGVVHNITSNAVELDYVSRSTSYSKKIGGMVLDADDVNLNEIENVDGAASFNIEILADNSPVEEGTSDVLEIRYEVENTGTVNDTQEIFLKIPGADSNPNNIINGSENSAGTGGVLVEPGATNSRISDGGSIVGTNGINNVTWGDNSGIPSGKNGTYTAYVYSENTTTGERTVDTTQISVDKSSGPGIPDGPVGFAHPSPVLEALAGVTQR